MTQQDFIQEFCNDNNVPLENFSRKYTALECKCGHKGCRGWMVLVNQKGIIDSFRKVANYHGADINK